jgi:hypothetical protein
MGEMTERERLRKIRSDIAQIDVSTNDGYKVRAAALTILFNAEHAVIGNVVLVGDRGPEHVSLPKDRHAYGE